MNTFVLSSENIGFPIKSLIDNLGSDEIRICDESGKVLAYLTPVSAREEQLYAEAQAWARANRDMLRERAARREGLTTSELLQRAESAKEK
jgi:hypothetical protein